MDKGCARVGYIGDCGRSLKVEMCWTVDGSAVEDTRTVKEDFKEAGAVVGRE